MIKQPKSLQLRRRYLLIETTNKEIIEKAILNGIGSIGYARTKPLFVNTNNKEIVLAIERKSLNEIRACFELSNSGIKIKRVSGTLKGLS